MRVLLGLLLLGIVGCGAVPAAEDSQAKVDKSPAQAAAEQKTDAKKSVEGAETLTLKAYSGIVWTCHQREFQSGREEDHQWQR